MRAMRDCRGGAGCMRALVDLTPGQRGRNVAVRIGCRVEIRPVANLAEDAMAIELKPGNLSQLPWPPPNSSRHRVQDHENWATVAAKYKMSARDLILFNFGTERPAEINWYLNHYVGCPDTPDKKNRMFSASASPGYIYYPNVKITVPAITVTSDPLKTRAWTLVKEFGARPGPGVWQQLSRKQVAEQMLERIDDPSLVNQGSAGLCPSASVVYTLVSTRPDEYVKAVTDLYDFGRTQIGKWKIAPGTDLKNYQLPPAARIPAADWVIMASIRDSENWLIDYEAETDNGGAWGDEVAEWLRKAGFTTVIEEWNSFFNKDEAHLRRANALYASGHKVCLLVHAEIVALVGSCAKIGWTFEPNHWVVLASKIAIVGAGSGSTVGMTVFSWGHKLSIPQLGCGPVHLSDFLQHYYGFVACKF
jgi:hypothetical protein